MGPGVRSIVIAAVAAAALAAALAIAAVTAGCSAPPPLKHPGGPGAPDGSAAELALLAPGADGTLGPISDGSEVTLVPGAQGGFHVWLGYRLRGVPAGETAIERDADRVSDGAVVLRYLDAVDVEPGGDGWFAPASPVPMFMCPTPIGLSILGVPIAYRLRVLDDAGAERAAARVTLVPRCPDGNAACARICAG
jgi:hypothetical protein